jgi:hypothetical protein
LFPRASNLFFFGRRLIRTKCNKTASLSELASERANEVFLLRQNNLFPEI